MEGSLDYALRFERYYANHRITIEVSEILLSQLLGIWAAAPLREAPTELAAFLIIAIN